MELTLCGSRKNLYPPHGRSLEIPRGRVGGLKKAKFLEEMYENILEFLGGGGGGGGAKQKTFCEGSMDIFWNFTFTLKVLTIY